MTLYIVFNRNCPFIWFWPPQDTGCRCLQWVKVRQPPEHPELPQVMRHRFWDEHEGTLVVDFIFVHPEDQEKLTHMWKQVKAISQSWVLLEVGVEYAIGN